MSCYGAQIAVPTLDPEFNQYPPAPQIFLQGINAEIISLDISLFGPDTEVS